MQIIDFLAQDGQRIYVYVWADVKEPRGVVQIFHGMSEHMKRYNEFAMRLNMEGFIVVGDDHRSHGLTAGDIKNIGKVKFGDLFSQTVKDEIHITASMKKMYPELPIYIIGHSYGSFLLQRYLELNSKAIDKAVIMGSACMKGSPDAIMGRFLCKFMKKDRPARMITKLSFDKYDKAAGDGRWITRDKAKCEEYYADEMCTQEFTYGFYKSFFGGMKTIYKRNELEKVAKELPILILSGEKDGVGGKNASLVKKLHDMYIDLGLNSVDLRIYEGARHEILNETNREEVYSDIVAFLKK